MTELRTTNGPASEGSSAEGTATEMPLDEQQILTALTEIAHTELEVDQELALSSRLLDDLALDSLKLLSLAVAVENRFEICLDEDDEQGISTVGELVRTIQNKLGTAPAETT